MKLLTFDEALVESSNCKKRHLLLGNGFSIACRPDIFRYDQLFLQADFSKLGARVKNVFAALDTTDFEKVIKSLRDAADLATHYGIDQANTQQMRNDADRLKELLVQTIADSHPASPIDISDDEYAACQRFLSYFDTTYTFNYDLLLYWTHMHHERPESVRSDDGFRTSQDDIDSGVESDYVVWESHQSHDQNMYYLHGALHIFDSGTEIQKYTWSRTGVKLIDQIREALNKDFFPLFVAEGTSDEKLERVRHSDYLAKALRSFEGIGGCLFVYGHSLAENDDHYLKVLERGKIERLYIGLYGDPNTPENRKMVARAELMQERRNKKRPMHLSFYDAASVSVWGAKT